MSRFFRFLGKWATSGLTGFISLLLMSFGALYGVVTIIKNGYESQLVFGGCVVALLTIIVVDGISAWEATRKDKK